MSDGVGGQPRFATGRSSGMLVRSRATVRVPVWLFLAGAGAIGWSNTLHVQRLMGWHVGLVNGYAAAPDQYRVLTPALAEAIFRALPGDGIEQELERLRTAYMVVHFLALVVRAG